MDVNDKARKSLAGALSTINLDEIQTTPRLEEKFRERLSKSAEIHKWAWDCHRYFLEEMKEKAKNGVFEH